MDLKKQCSNYSPIFGVLTYMPWRDFPSPLNVKGSYPSDFFIDEIHFKIGFKTLTYFLLATILSNKLGDMSSLNCKEINHRRDQRGAYSLKALKG